MTAKRALTWTAAALGVMVAMLAGAVIAGWTRFNRQIAREVSELLTRTPEAPEIITEERLESLPDPVRRYLSYTGVVGKPVVKSVHLRQRGAMRPTMQLPWLPLEAEQYYSTDPPGFVWVGVVHLGALPLVRARDRYFDGRGNMLIKIGSIFPVADATGPETDQSSMMRYLSEMIWFPAAFLAPNISFEAIDDHSAKVTLTDHGRSDSATMYFDDEGRVTNLIAQRSWNAGSDSGLTTWETPITEYGEFEGLKLPVRGQAIWKLPEGDFPYIDVEITDIRYNPNAR